MALRIFFYEGGALASHTGYSGQEMAALLECIDSLWSPTYHSHRTFEVVEEDDDLWLVYRDELGEYPIPEEWLTKTIQFGLPKTKPLRLVGDRLPISPRQLGLSPWSLPMHVQFLPE